MNNKTLVPISIVIAAVIIGGAVLFTNKGASNNKTDGTEDVKVETVKFTPVSEDDHILGNPNAKVMLVEYSDFECPFCKRFQTTLHQIIDEYGASGDVAWVYRHFPIAQLHPKNGQRASVASECAFDLGGEDVFWQFTDAYYEKTPSNDQTDFDTVVGDIVTSLGLDTDAFGACLDENDFDGVKADFDDGVAIGVRATPTTAFVFDKSLSLEGANVMDAINTKYAGAGNPNPIRRLNNDTIILMSGAFPIEDVRTIIDTILFDQG
jgi:protein-disulfide isomerase